MILTTSNLSGSIDDAFIDRADIKRFIGNPGMRARFLILRDCLEVDYLLCMKHRSWCVQQSFKILYQDLIMRLWWQVKDRTKFFPCSESVYMKVMDWVVDVYGNFLFKPMPCGYVAVLWVWRSIWMLLREVWLYRIDCRFTSRKRNLIVCLYTDNVCWNQKGKLYKLLLWSCWTTWTHCPCSWFRCTCTLSRSCWSLCSCRLPRSSLYSIKICHIWSFLFCWLVFCRIIFRLVFIWLVFNRFVFCRVLLFRFFL